MFEFPWRVHFDLDQLIGQVITVKAGFWKIIFNDLVYILKVKR